MNRTLMTLAALLVATASLRPASAITIETVPVGDAGNPGDVQPKGTFGAVAYEYYIGTFEVTIGQYTEFLNAVAATDTYSLYNEYMCTNDNIAGILRSGSPGSFTYSTMGTSTKPITYVSWGDAARFANWLHNGQPTGLQNASTTEDGAYTLNGATDRVELYFVTRNAGAKWFIPSEDEWHKAAYYQPAEKGGDADSYWMYPMRTNSTPHSDQPPGATPDNSRVGNFYGNDGLPNGYDDGYAVSGSMSFADSQVLTEVGAYSSSPSYYNTFDQGGNVWEWTEARIPSGASRGLRGGSWESDATALMASTRPGNFGALEMSALGFRVAAVPEPSTVALAALGVAALAVCRRRRHAR